MIDRRSFFKTASAAFAALVTLSGAAFADAGKVRLKFGVNGGSGTLTFQGRTYPLRIGGLTLGTIGASGGTLVGTARNLRAASDIVGTYTAVGAGIALAGGARVFRMQNQNGVVLELRGRQIGFEANAGLGGFSLSL